MNFNIQIFISGCWITTPTEYSDVESFYLLNIISSSSACFSFFGRTSGILLQMYAFSHPKSFLHTCRCISQYKCRFLHLYDPSRIVCDVEILNIIKRYSINLLIDEIFAHIFLFKTTDSFVEF